MGLTVVRQRSAGAVLCLALAGLVAGVAAGFLVSEMAGIGGHRRLGRLIRSRKPSRRAAPPPGRAALIESIRAALASEAALRGEAVEVISRGARGLELRGWVASRPARSLAYRLTRTLSDGLEIANRLLVRGEDDGAAQRTRGEAPRPA